MSNPFRRVVAAAAVASLAGAGAFFGASPAQSIPEDPDCPAAYPLDELARGQLVDGLTVSSGKEPEVFTGEVLGVLDDGIAAGLDMVIVRLTSGEIDRVGGIWQGMSGSPVYAADGRLIGAVSYGLAWGSSPVAGVTPAADMQALLTRPSDEGAATDGAVQLSGALQRRIVTSGAATPQEVESGLERLPVPVAVSGMANTARLNKAAQKMGLENVRFYRASSAPVTPAAAEDEIFAGSNLAASMSYGDLSAVGTGTTTMVCDGKVVGFGHPFGFAGDTSLTLHGADAIFIQEDPLGAPFKISNATGPVGVIDQDRLAGIKGLLNAVPDTALVRTIVTGPTGIPRTGDTHVSVPGFMPDATAFGLLSNIDRVFDHIGKGSALVHFTISGTTSDGEPFTVVRTNRYADTFDVAFPSIFESADAVWSLQENEFTDVDIDEVEITSSLSAKARMFRVGKVERRFKDGTTKVLRSDSRIRVLAGRKIKLRVTLNSVKDKFGTLVFNTAVRVPADQPFRSFGSLTVGSNSGFGEFEDYEGYDDGESGPASFEELVDSIEDAPRNDELTTTLEFYTDDFDGLNTTQSKRLVSEVITNSRSFEVRVVR